jgi:hypothetical protein
MVFGAEREPATARPPRAVEPVTRGCSDGEAVMRSQSFWLRDVQDWLALVAGKHQRPKGAKPCRKSLANG